MRDILDRLLDWQRHGVACALATVVRTSGSAPRPIGTSMAVSADGEVLGSLSGGCVEGAVYELAREAIAEGVTLGDAYGIADGDAFAAGLTCGGEIEVQVRPLGAAEYAVLRELAALRDAGRPVALAVPVGDGASAGTERDWFLATPDRLPGGPVGEAARRALSDGTARPGAADGSDPACTGASAAYLVVPFVPPPRLLVYGATDFAGALSRIGRFLGYRVTVCDARPVFTTAERFPDADEVVVQWPHRHLESIRGELDARTAVCVLTHDPKFDVPLLVRALRSPVGYVGAMGSRRTHADRLERLREAGLSMLELAALHSPIGLDLAGSSPEETALSIAAEIVAARRGGSGAPLGALSAPIHAAAFEASAVATAVPAGS
ncbi:XdhC family protein [Streptomyces longispororuber]|uniref:XdhC family protein n=1 Tax=Streptomyces longispororuber TaxID=68230 RepID=UPI00210D83A3|nr:XdhC/CoxI family protein [Streptomyces longispororuber]MCQ4206601.1 XdhC family protein [Streptomyces longispororuber]